MDQFPKNPSFFFDQQPLDHVITTATGVIDIYNAIKAEIENADITVEKAQEYAKKFWSLSSTLSECIYQVESYANEYTTRYNIRYSKVINQKYDSAKAAEIMAKNDEEYLRLRYKETQSIQTYLSYLSNLKDDFVKGHHMMKTFYEKQCDLLIITPKTT